MIAMYKKGLQIFSTKKLKAKNYENCVFKISHFFVLFFFYNFFSEHFKSILTIWNQHKILRF
jgi:hypothetical protein